MQTFLCSEDIMKKYCIILTGMILSLSFNLFADNEADSLVAYSNIWKTAGCDSLTLTIRDIDITNIEPIVSFNTTTSLDDTTYFDSTIPNDDIDDSNVFNDLIDFLVLRKLNILEHIRINIPSGVYNFSNQIVMHSNISLKGAGST